MMGRSKGEISAAAQLPLDMDLIGGPLFRISAVVICALSFGAGLYNGASADVGSEFFAAFVLEVAMSAENLVAIYLVFRYFRVPPGVAQEHVLWWGFGISAVLRGAVIISGGLFIAAQKEAILLFACVVIYSGYRLAINSVPEDMVDETSEEGNKVIAAFQRVVPVSDYFDGVNFVTTNPVDGSSRLTPLFLVLLVIEATDLIFALDNVPALYSIVPSGNVLVVYAATLFGIATLRASYTLVAVSLPRMVHLQRTTGAVLILVGVRSIADYFEKGHIFPPLQFLGLVVAILVAGMSASLYQAADTLGAGSDATAEGDAAGSMRRMERGADPMAAAMQGDAWAPGGDVHGELFSGQTWGGGSSSGGGAGSGAGGGGGDNRGGAPRPTGGSNASKMISNVMNIDADFPRRSKVSATPGVQPLAAVPKMNAQD